MTDTEPTARERIERLLADRGYHIEFNGHLSNHAKHAVVALAGLGTPPERIEAYYENYAKMTTYGSGLEPPRPPRHQITEENWEQHLGQRTSWGSYCEFFEARRRELGTDGMLRRYAARLIPGWVGAFTHAAIHLGWGLDAGSEWMTVEGIAYLAYVYLSCHPERALPAGAASAGSADASAVDSLLRIAAAWERDGDAFRQHIRAATEDTEAGLAAGIHPELARSGLQFRIAATLRTGHPLMYQTPAWLEERPVAVCWEQLYYAVTLLYLAKPGDFILLHLITSLHAVERIADRLPAEQQREAVRCFWIGMLGIAFSGADFPRIGKLAALHTLFADTTDPGGEAAWAAEWARTIARAVEEEEEHNPKLVYVARLLWRRSGLLTIYRTAAAQFTATPELPPSFEEPPTE